MTRPVEADFSTGYVYSQPDWGQQGYFVDSFRYDLWGDYYAQPYVYYQAGMGTDSYDEGVWSVTYIDGGTDPLFDIKVTYQYQ